MASAETRYIVTGTDAILWGMRNRNSCKYLNNFVITMQGFGSNKTNHKIITYYL